MTEENQIRERMKLLSLTKKGKRAILRYLRNNGSCKRLELERYVMSILNMKELKDGTIVHRTKPIHSLAFILAHEELESTEEIKIQRRGIPYPMTDFETIFSLI